MNDPHDMGNRPVAPSVSPLVRQAAWNLHRLELLLMAGTFAWTNSVYHQYFWRTQRMMAVTPEEAAAWLPAVAVTVQRETWIPVLEELTYWPLPEPLPPEARPWRDALIQSWEQHPAATDWHKSIRLAALVRLDRRAERLPEWLAETRQSLDLEWYHRYFRLAGLAGWRPRPGDRPPHTGSTEVAHGTNSTGAAPAWIRFWEELYRSPDLNSLMATVALLHLAEGGWLPSGPSPERLREEFLRQMRQQYTSSSDRLVLRILLSSVPAGSPTSEREGKNVMDWLELTRWNTRWEKREAVWEMLAAWQREGVLERCGGSLAPDLARALEWEDYGDVLIAMAGYVPGLAEVRAHPEAMRAIIARWEALSRSDNWQIRRTAWVARWNLMRAGALTAEEQTRFGADYMEAIGAEKTWDVLLALAQITPPGTFPLAIWTRRLSDQDDRCRLAARLAIHGWLVEVMEGASGEWRVASGSEASGEWRVASGSSRLATRCSLLAARYSLLATRRRQVRQALRRAGQEGAGNRPVAPFVNLPPEVWPDFRRLREIETALAAGHLPPSPDAGMENRPAPRTVPARLPESHPRTDPPGITDRTTGRTAGSEPPARHPFPEVIRHE